MFTYLRYTLQRFLDTEKNEINIVHEQWICADVTGSSMKNIYGGKHRAHTILHANKCIGKVSRFFLVRHNFSCTILYSTVYHPPFTSNVLDKLCISATYIDTQLFTS
jgi:hypothetical protein